MTDRHHSRAELIAAFVLGALLSPQSPDAKSLIALEPCRIGDIDEIVSIGARCGRVAVAENPDQPGGRRIELRVAVVPAVATQAAPDPLFLIAGGPGQGAIETFAPQLDAFAGLRRTRDLVMVDQRGTGGSNRLDCPTPEDELATTELPPAELKAIARECLAGLPGQVEFYTTSVAVRDLDAVRAALGYSQVNLYAGSYGTRVAQHYLRRYPEQVRSVVLDGLVPPGLPLVPRIAIESQAALDRVFARCAADAECNRRYPDLAGQFEKVDGRLRAGSVAVKLADPVSGELRPVEVTRAHLVVMARMLTYGARTASILPLVLHEAATHGNYLPLAAQGEMLADQLERIVTTGMHHSVVCAEDAPGFGGAVDHAELERTYIGPIMVEGMAAICEVWPRGPVDADFHDPLDTDVPALFLSGEYDPATPPAYGAAAAGGFANGLHVIVPGQGHGQTGSPCVQRLIRRFIDRGSTAGLDASCVEVLEPAPFFLSFSGPAP